MGDTENVGALSSFVSRDIMKTYKNLFGKICSFDNMMLAFRKTKKGRSNRDYVRKFESKLEHNLLQLKRELENQDYEPMPLDVFVIRDPKTRVISAPHFRDRVVHQALCNIIEPIFNATFIHDSYASRKGKGTHAALRRFDVFKRKVSHNGRPVNGAKDNNMVLGYVLKCDIKHYFASVDHEILMNIISRRLKDRKALQLLRKTLSCYDCSGFGKGMPIGALTSQLFANIYLNELDHFVKHELGAKYYMRYMDDFIVLGKISEELEQMEYEISVFLKTLKIQLHPEKSKIFPLHNGVSFLGYRTFYNYMLLKKNSLALLRDRLARFSDNQKAGESLEGWLAYARHANSLKQTKRAKQIFDSMFTCAARQYLHPQAPSQPRHAGRHI